MHTELELLVEVSERTARMETKLDTLVLVSADHEDRIRKTERWRWSIPGAGVIAALVALLSGVPHHS